MVSYSFEALEAGKLPDPTRDKLVQYGIFDHLSFARFRFNKQYNDLGVAAFLRELVASDQYRSSPVSRHRLAGEVKYQKLRCTELNLNMLDRLEEHGIVGHNEYIKKTYQDPVNGVEIVDRLREALIMQESELYEIYSSEERQELLFVLLKLVVIGGNLNQYEDYLTPYREVVKELYKQVVSVRKDPSTSQMFADTHAYAVQAVDGETVHINDSDQNLHLVLVHPFTKTVIVMRHENVYSL